MQLNLSNISYTYEGAASPALDDADKGRVLSLVAGLNSDPDALREGPNISPGELKKLLIAEQLLQEPNLLILD